MSNQADERSTERCINITKQLLQCKCKPKGKYGNTSYCSNHFYLINIENRHLFDDAPDFFNNNFFNKKIRNLAEKSKKIMDFAQDFSGKKFTFTVEQSSKELNFKFNDSEDYFSLIHINNLKDVTSMIDFKSTEPKGSVASTTEPKDSDVPRGQYTEQGSAAVPSAQYTFKSIKIIGILEDKEDFDIVVNILYKKENIYLFIELRNE